MTHTKCLAVTGPGEGGKSRIRLWFTGSHKPIYSSPSPLPVVSLLRFQLPVVNCSLKMLHGKFWK